MSKLLPETPPVPPLLQETPVGDRPLQEHKPLLGYQRAELVKYWADERYKPIIDKYLGGRGLKDVTSCALSDYENILRLCRKAMEQRIRELRAQIGVEDLKDHHDALERTWKNTRRF